MEYNPNPTFLAVAIIGVLAFVISKGREGAGSGGAKTELHGSYPAPDFELAKADYDPWRHVVTDAYMPKSRMDVKSVREVVADQ